MAQLRRVVFVMTSGWSVSHCHAVQQDLLQGGDILEVLDGVQL